jgi:cellulose synthase/poly-beta-1,6-N-acetylglucosamine synthase-like glycosyltransferase
VIDIAVVVCAHDERRWDSLRLSLDSLQRQSLGPPETVVVIDHNSALLGRAEKELGVKVVPNTDRRGLGGARNSGIAATTAPVVAFLDDDAVALPDWLRLVAAEYESPDVAGVGGSIQPLWEDGRPGWFPPEFDWVVGCTFKGMPEVRGEVRNVHGCNMSFRRSVLDELGGFRLGYGCDETELCIRIHQRWAEKTIVYLPEASVFHHVPPDRARVGRFLSRCYFEGGSKAVVAHLVGRSEGLAAERRYTRSVVPAAAARGFRELGSGNPAGGARACLILAGVAWATAGYLVASVSVEKAARARGWGPDVFPRHRPRLVRGYRL